MSVKVNIKWGKELFKDVEVNLSGTAADFRQQLFSLTNVVPENQKVMGKGATLKDEQWEAFKKVLVPGAALMMMGTPSQAIQAVTEVATTKFIEDMPEEAQMAVDLAPGLENLGNTCYMNASLQMMNSMPELQEALAPVKLGSMLNADPETRVTVAMKDVLVQLRHQKMTVTPTLFLAMLRQSFPRFAEQVGGRYIQQSADECWNQLVQCFRKAPVIKVQPPTDLHSGIEQLLQGESITTTQCLDAPEESPSIEHASFESLHCHIDSKVSFMFQGINQSLNSSLVKRSPSTNGDAKYSVTTRLERLPYYLVVQFLRFEIRKDQKNVLRNKILKPVEFPFDLDTLEFCSDSLKSKLSEKREAIRIRNDTPAADRKPVLQDPLTNQSGFYELSAVLTHQGRDIDGGHYVCWVRQDGDNWLLFDDDKVSPATPEDIKKLVGHGGADWHQAYMCLYRTKQFN